MELKEKQRRAGQDALGAMDFVFDFAEEPAKEPFQRRPRRDRAKAFKQSTD
jgi:hypothetical protein